MLVLSLFVDPSNFHSIRQQTAFNLVLISILLITTWLFFVVLFFFFKFEQRLHP